jgi:hypothetical protein
MYGYGYPPSLMKAPMYGKVKVSLHLLEKATPTPNGWYIQ